MAGLANDSLSAVNPTRIDWGFKAWVVRKYNVENYSNKDEVNTVELVLQDREGTRIHASIRKALIQQKADKICEHDVYIMKNFVVVQNSAKYKINSHPYKLLFMKNTQIAEVDDEGFPTSIFQFKPYEEIIGNLTIDDGELFDIIGEIVGSDSVKTQGTRESAKKLIDLEIRDAEDKRLFVTLWGEIVDMVDSFIKKASTDPVIIILQLGRAKNFMGDVKVRSALYASKVFVNTPFPQLEEFHGRLLSGRVSPTQGISQISSSSVYSIVEDLESGTHMFRQVVQLIEEEEVTKFWLIVTIQEVESEEDWWYLGCKKCSKKLTTQDKHFYCGKCKVSSSTGVPKFKVQVRVGDGTGSIVLLLWDRECMQLIGKLAKELRECIVKDVEGRSYPVDIDSLVDKKLLCKVEVRAQNIIGNDDVYSVVHFTSDPELISKYEVILHEQTKQRAKLSMREVSTEIISNDSVSENEVNTPGISQLGHGRIGDMYDELFSKDVVDGGPSSSMSTNKIRRIVKTQK